MTNDMPKIVGNENLRRRLCEDVRGGTLAHAYILEGPAQSGKHTVARQLTAALACENRSKDGTSLPCGTCPACRKILEGKSPDLIMIGREDKATIGVETIRGLREDVHTYPNDLDFKMYVIEDAHSMTVQAQNAFLLTLEEPPSFVRFLLLCENTQTILETIKSRAPILRTEPIPRDLMSEYLCRENPQARSVRDTSPREWQEILLAADGCIGRVEQLLNPKVRKPILARRELAQEFLSACLTSRERASRMIAMGNAIGNKRDEVCELFLTIETAIRDLMMLKKEENAPLLFYPDREEALALSDRIGAATLMRLYEACEDARCAIFIRNANIRLTFMDFVLKAGMIRSENHRRYPMDQQQEQQKKKRPYHNNRRRSNNRPAGQEGGKNPAVQENTQSANAPAQGAPANNGGNRQPNERTQGERPQNERRGDGRGNNRGRGGNDIHTRRGGFRPAPDAPSEEAKQPTVPENNREGAHGTTDKRENSNRENNRDGNRENNRDNNRGGRQRGGKGRDGNRQKDSAPREGAARDGSKSSGRADNREENRAEGRDNHTPEIRTEGHGNDRGRHGSEGMREGGRNRQRRGENRAPLPEVAPKRETVQTPRDPEMDAWFATPTEAKLSETSSPVAEAETAINVELNLNDILPPIALQKYEDPAKEAVEEAEQPEGAPEEPVATVEVIGVRFNKAGKVYYFAPNGNVARKGDAIIVETARGLEFGEAWQPNHEVPESDIVPPLRPVVRLADERDIAHNADNRRREDDAFRICLDKIKAHGLDMKLVEAQYTFDNSKLLFYFTSAGRVDFRELVKDLASVFRTRIELRQIGIRDEAKLMGGLGICGRPLCCASFLSDFSQVSIKMAKEQNLSLNSAKISGTCGRLMCCLNYEYPVYCEAARHTPPLGSTVSTPEGVGTVVETNPLGGMVKVSLANAQPGTVPQYYRREDVKVLNMNRQHAAEVRDEDESDEISE